ncbi:carbon monoxide dehydrogenase [candidate division MSBL1 archaeon SCGC-AAA382A20]|uniref:Carbon monoxide dehydrogenase n=1 Tax=candidate division MSBL1 archaeon SCGC-AAA382A20 TaxID=1698280 RepID=A0A133VIR5_9EURY|nr:carbon monoxide dehydrogenase [candidate division MSBL1 archaeon SCGC-AAA382A20]
MDKVSAHKSIQELHEKVEKDDMTNVNERFEAMDGVRCPYCEKGVRCNICSNGPCRLIEGKTERGVCGIDKDGMVMRNILRINSMGTAAYTYHANTAAKTLKETGKGNTLFEITDEEKLKKLADRIGLDTTLNNDELAIKLGDFLLEEINRDSDEPSEVILEFASESRKETWEELGILPGGPLHELMDVKTSVMTNVDSDYESMALKTLRMGLATSYGSLTLLEEIQDILFGTAKPHKAEVDTGILDPEYVNILPNGHEPFIGAALIQIARREEIQEKAKKAGAKGVRIIGSIETGQELLQRFETDDVFVGLTGNWINQEYILATGAVDAFAADMNCTVPTAGKYAERYNSLIVPVTKLVNVPGVEHKINYKPEKAEEQALEIVDMAIENFKDRKDEPTNVPEYKQEITTGFSPKALLDALGGSLDPLLENIKNGNIKGIVALVSCTTLKNGPHDKNTINVAEELIKRDILVLSAGCGNAALQVGGLTTLDAQEKAGEGLKEVCEALKIPPVLSFGTCTDTGRILNLVTDVAEALDVDPTELPVAVTAPEYMEQKATIAAIAAIGYGLYTHVSPTPPVTGSDNVVKLLTQDIESLTGGKLAVGDEPEEIVDGIVSHIEEKREGLGL